MRSFLLIISAVIIIFTHGISQNDNDSSIYQKVKTKLNMANNTVNVDLLEPSISSEKLNLKFSNSVSKANYYNIDNQVFKFIRTESPETMEFTLERNNDEVLNLELILVEPIKSLLVKRASSPKQSFNYNSARHYWGIVNDDENSMVSLSFLSGEIMGVIFYNGETYNLGRIKEVLGNEYILFKENDLLFESMLSCDTDATKHAIGKQVEHHLKAENPSNCINMYVEVDHDIFLDKGGVNEAAQYVEGVFSQVSLLYENEAINLQISEIVVWDIQDPYTGPSTSDYLTQFRDRLNGAYNGDLAHLVGYRGGGGIAYLDVVCNDFYGVAYSDINSTYANVPTYSWTVMVVTHEIGHNLGSSHTHDCRWNGNNTAIDGCGPAVGYSGSGSCPNGPEPDAGTIMSYCHLVAGVGIDLRLGFGTQPGNLIRDRVYNANCLQSCSNPVLNDAGISKIITPSGENCQNSLNPEVELYNFGTEPLTSVTISYQLDAQDLKVYNWTGSLASATSTTVTLPTISYENGSHSFTAYTSLPNGVTDEDSSNDGLSTSFNRPDDQTYYADNDGDGFGDLTTSLIACNQPIGYVLNNTDCNDNDPSAYPGAFCSDNDVCTVNDVLDNNCQCSGQFIDSDGDTVCDAEDQCPGENDLVDENENGTPDGCECNLQFQPFNNNNLTHTGSGNSFTTVNLPSNSKDAEFTISKLDAVKKGNPRNRFIDEVRVDFIDGNGNLQTLGTYGGGNNSMVTIKINGALQSVTVYLYDAYDGNANTTLSIDLSQIKYCAQVCQDADQDGICDSEDQCLGFDDNLLGSSCNDGDPCTINDSWVSCSTCTGSFSGDSDNDGVCNAEDICEGGDDNLDTDGDGVPDFCDNNCDPAVTNFDVNPLRHTGSGSSFAKVSFGSIVQDVTFNISNLNSVSRGKPDRRYVEEVIVTYVKENGGTVIYGTFRGDQQNNVNVEITETVTSVQVELRYLTGTGGAEANMSIQLSDLQYCVSATPQLQESQAEEEPLQVKIYPNPSNQYIKVEVNRTIQNGLVILRDLSGRHLGEYHFNDQFGVVVDLQKAAFSSSIVLISVIEETKIICMEKVLLLQ